MSDLLTSLIRTAVPAVVGAIGASRIAMYVDAALAAEALAAFITVVYYAAVRLVETFAPTAGWLLGVPKQPVYTLDTAVLAEANPAKDA